MASTNVDLVRPILEEWERGNFSSAEWAHPEIEYVSADPVLPLDRAGLAEMADVWRKWLRAWEDFRVDVEECHEVDGGRVLVLVRYSGRANPGGLQVEPIEAACLFHVHDGKVAKLVLYWDRERAFTDVNLRPQRRKSSCKTRHTPRAGRRLKPSGALLGEPDSPQRFARSAGAAGDPTGCLHGGASATTQARDSASRL